MQKNNLIRLSASEGYYLTDGERFVKVIDIGEGQSEDDWEEVPESYLAKLQARMTPREFILALMNKGVTRQQLDTLINSSDQVWAELNYATTILRSNPLLDQLCSQVGLTTQDLDEIFGLV